MPFWVTRWVLTLPHAGFGEGRLEKYLIKVTRWPPTLRLDSPFFEVEFGTLSLLVSEGIVAAREPRGINRSLRERLMRGKMPFLSKRNITTYVKERNKSPIIH